VLCTKADNSFVKMLGNLDCIPSEKETPKESVQRRLPRIFRNLRALRFQYMPREALQHGPLFGHVGSLSSSVSIQKLTPGAWLLLQRSARLHIRSNTSHCASLLEGLGNARCKAVWTSVCGDVPWQSSLLICTCKYASKKSTPTVLKSALDNAANSGCISCAVRPDYMSVIIAKLSQSLFKDKPTSCNLE
jgi:hypothetical protein